jgi:hypothetical protein
MNTNSDTTKVSLDNIPQDIIDLWDIKNLISED